MTPTDPRHGTRACYLKGCRNTPCVDANRDYCKRYRNRRILSSSGEVTTPAETVIPHLTELRRTMSLGAIAVVAGTGSGHIYRIIAGETKRISNTMATSLLAIRPDSAAGGRWISAGNSARRIQSLVALGYSFSRIDKHVGCGRQNLYVIASGERTQITSDLDQRVRAAWEILSMRLPEPANKYEAGGVTKARNIAIARGWLPPLAWNDIDNDSGPINTFDSGIDKESVDLSVVERILDGDSTLASAATKAERRLVRRHWVARGYPINELARLTGWKPERYVDTEAA